MPTNAEEVEWRVKRAEKTSGRVKGENEKTLKHSPMHRQRQVARLDPSVPVQPLTLGLNPLDLLLLKLHILLGDALHSLELGLSALGKSGSGAVEEGARTEVTGDLAVEADEGSVGGIWKRVWTKPKPTALRRRPRIGRTRWRAAR